MRSGLLATAAPIQPWGGEFNWWHSILDLRAFGLSWAEIERDVMSRPAMME